jgi:amino acid adenylation domain-containing protein
MSAQSLIEILYKSGAILSVEEGDLLIKAPDNALTDELLSKVKAFKSDIVNVLNKLELSRTLVKLTKQYYPLSYCCPASLAQQRMLFMEELAGNNSYYNIPVIYKIRGVVNKVALSQAFLRLVTMHDVLRSTYLFEDNSYIQKIHTPQGFLINERSIINDTNKDNLLEELIKTEVNHIFDLAHEWPFRVSLFECAHNEYVLSINIHHIAADGWSARNIIHEISRGYTLYKDQSIQLDVNDLERGYQYADYIQWQTAWQETDDYQEARNYWASLLRGAAELHSLPTDFVRPSIQSVWGDTYRHVISTPVASALTQSAVAKKTTPFSIVQTVFAAFLARYSGESDIVFGTVSANRQPLEFVNTVGLFVNTLVLRYSIGEDSSFEKLLQQTEELNSRAVRFQSFPFDAIVDELQPVRSLGYNPLVQIMLVMQENITELLKLDGVNVLQHKQHQKVSKFDLSLHVFFNNNQVIIDWEYSTSLFTLKTIQAMAANFEGMLDSLLSAPAQHINEVALVSSSMLKVLVDSEKFPTPFCVHALFEQQVAMQPENIAVSQGDQLLSYKELNEMANHLADHLYSIFAGEIGRVGLCMEKSAELLVSLLAIMKVGAVYVPLDPHYPKERLGWMIQDSGINILLTGNDTNVDPELGTGIKILSVPSLLDTEVLLKHKPANDINSPAYVIYTSGSTGKPKGVLVSHRSLFYSLHANKLLMDIGKDDLMPTIGSQAFGVSLLEIFLPLISGGTVQVINKAQIIDMEQFVAVTNKVTILHAVPSLMRQWLDVVSLNENRNQYPNLRLLLVGGESVPDTLLRKIKDWRPNVRLVELYGMTESTVVCSSYEVQQDSHAHYCIGRPHPNTYFYVLNPYGQQQPIGVPGELHIGGLSLADEYINQPEITAEKFIVNPHLNGERLYKTGDRVRLLDDGNYEFLGRVDHQVSLRGVRIELGEIETLAIAVDGIKQVVAHVVSIDGDEKILVLYYTTNVSFPDHVTLSDAVRMHLARHLPDYMRPSLIQYLESLPLNPNGKVDRKKLPAPTLVATIVEPRTDIERQLVEMWKVVLQCESVSVTANFFEIGGHSLMATKLLTKIRSTFDISIPLATLFQSPNIHSCASVIEKLLKEKYAKSLIRKDMGNESENDEELIL